MPTLLLMLRVMTHFNIGALLAILFWVVWQFQTLSPAPLTTLLQPVAPYRSAPSTATCSPPDTVTVYFVCDQSAAGRP